MCFGRGEGERRGTLCHLGAEHIFQAKNISITDPLCTKKILKRKYIKVWFFSTDSQCILRRINRLWLRKKPRVLKTIGMYYR